MLSRGPAVALALSLAVPVLSVAALAPASAAGVPTCHGVAATVVGTAGRDRLVGTSGNDVIVGLGGNDRISAGAGDDLVCGGNGADRLLGGRGDDTLDGGHDQRRRQYGFTEVNGDVLDGGPGNDVLRARTDKVGLETLGRPNTVSYQDSPRAVHVDLRAGTATGEGQDTIVPGDFLEVHGSTHDDTLTGSRRSDLLFGDAGDDVLSGRGEADVIMDGAGEDTVAGGSGADFLAAIRGPGQVAGGPGRDFLLSLQSRGKMLQGGTGDDTVLSVLGTSSAGSVDGGAGEDVLGFLSEADDWFFRSVPASSAQAPSSQQPSFVVDRAAGSAAQQSGAATSTVAMAGFEFYSLVGSGTWTYAGTDAVDNVSVFAGRLKASTFGGDDVLLGDSRNDVLDGGADVDTAFGAGGTNTCLNDEKGKCDGYPSGPDGPILFRSSHAGRPAPSEQLATAQRVLDTLR